MEAEQSFTQRWLFALAVFVVLGYAWLSVRLLEPRLTLPDFVGHAVWYEEGRLIPIRNLGPTRSRHYLESAAVFNQAKNLNHEVSLLGPFPSSVQLIINAENPRVVGIAEDRIELGYEVAAADGQLLKAFVKAWLLQTAGRGITSSQLRMEVASDVILGLVRGEFSLQQPKGPKLKLDPIGNWLKAAASFAKSCNHSWMPIEMSQLCGGSNELNPLTLRPLLTSVLLEAFASTSPLARMNTAHEWVKSLATVPPFSEKTPINIIEWRKWVRAQVQMLKAPDNPGLQAALHRAQLTENPNLQVDIVLHMKDGPTVDDSRSASFTSLVAQDGHYSLEPAGLTVTDTDLAVFHAPIAVRSGCERNSVLDVLSEPVKTKSVLKLACPHSRVELSGLASGGVGLFARENPHLAFLYLNRIGLERALRKSLLHASGSVDQLITSGQDVSPLLGLDKAEWNAPMRAFHVKGAIEAVEWFRAVPAPQAAR